MIIKYGIKDNTIDVTDICYSKLCRNNVICIPEGDLTRVFYFGDPLSGVLKSIFITNYLGETIEGDHKSEITIDVANNFINVVNQDYLYEKLQIIHNKIKLEFGSLRDEYPEQIMTVKFLTGKEKVLEIGGNIGRNSLVISTILNENNNNNFVSLESSKYIACQLRYNRDINNCNFHY